MHVRPIRPWQLFSNASFVIRFEQLIERIITYFFKQKDNWNSDQSERPYGWSQTN